MRRGELTRYIRMAGLVALLTVVGIGGVVQAQGVTEEQMRMLQQLPPDEREGLMRSLGIQLPTQQIGSVPETAPTTAPVVVQPPQDQEQRLKGGDSLVLTLQFPVGLSSDAMASRQQTLSDDRWLDELRGSNTFRLDKDGVLNLPGVTSIPLAGLTPEEAARRIAAEDALSVFEATVTYLPLVASARDSLKPFGYLTFTGAPVSFAPATDIPVPSDYVIGPGDTISVQLFGNINAQYELAVNRDGMINLPEIGPISVAGLEFSEMKEALESRITEQKLGVQTSITMGTLRSIRIFVLGDVTRPGSYTVSSLSTVTNAMYVAGGVTPSGSLRDVQVKRSGRLVQRIDGYDFMMKGDTSSDIRLQPGDVIFVPPIGPTVGVAGQVRRPAIYEIVGDKTVAEAIDLAGGLLPTAYLGQARLERIGADGNRKVLTLSLRSEQEKQLNLRDGDVLYVDPVLDRLGGSVQLSGHVYRPGSYQWRAGMRVSDLIPSVAHLKPMADRGYVLIRREMEPGGPIDVLSADLAAALRDVGGPADLPLKERDQVIVFDMETGRSRQIAPILDELRLQASLGEPREEVIISGQVRAPGVYPLEDGMTVSDLIRAGAELKDSAYSLRAELTRYQVDAHNRRTSRFLEVDLAAVLAGDEAADVLLQPYDVLSIKETPLWREQWSIELRGEITFPGRYTIVPGETLSQALARAGGLTEFAFAGGSVFLREDLRERERAQLARLADRIETDLATMTLQSSRVEAATRGTATLAQSMSIGQSMLAQLRNAEARGRLVIDLDRILTATNEQGGDLVLKNGDILIVPQLTQEVTVIGEVQYSTSHFHQPGMRLQEYVDLSGGLTANADRKRIYVVRANGLVQATNGGSSKWFRNSGNSDIRAGDTIVVPLDVDRLPRLALWQSATTIIYNLAIAAAAVGSL